MLCFLYGTRSYRFPDYPRDSSRIFQRNGRNALDRKGGAPHNKHKLRFCRFCNYLFLRMPSSRKVSLQPDTQYMQTNRRSDSRGISALTLQESKSYLVGVPYSRARELNYGNSFPHESPPKGFSKRNMKKAVVLFR